MTEYAPPVSGLLKLGRPDGITEETDYAPHGIGIADVPELIRLLNDDDLAWADSDGPETYAQVHAWRALAQLRAPEAVEPLLDLLAAQENDEDWNDWVSEEVPTALGRIGPGIIPATVAWLERRGQQEHAPCYYANALVEVARRYNETRPEVIAQLCRVLDTAVVNNASLNGYVVGNLVDLNAVEAWPTIERAFATGNVDESIRGDEPEAKYQLGLGPKPPRQYDAFPSRQPAQTGSNAKQRFNERQRKKKAEKRKNKKKRK